MTILIHVGRDSGVVEARTQQASRKAYVRDQWQSPFLRYASSNLVDTDWSTVHTMRGRLDPPAQDQFPD